MKKIYFKVHNQRVVLKAWFNSEKPHDVTIKVMTQENAIKNTFGKNTFVFLWTQTKILFVRFELNSSENSPVILCNGYTAAICKLLDISLTYDAIFDEGYATKIGQLYGGTASILYAKVTSVYYKILYKKESIWQTDVNNLS